MSRKRFTAVTRNLAGWWPLDDHTGEDASGYGNHAFPTNSPIPVATNIGGGRTAEKFNATNNYWRAPNFSWPTTNVQATVTFWINTADGTTSAFTVGNAGPPTDQFQSHAPYSGSLYWDYPNSNPAFGRISCSFASGLNRWTHVALVSNGSNYRAIYFDNVLQASNTNSSGTGPGNLTGLYIGAWPTGGTYCKGAIRDFRIYNRDLNIGEIYQLYLEGLQPEIILLEPFSRQPIIFLGTVSVFMRPDADFTDGSWLNELGTNTNLFASVDETPFSDSDYIQSQSANDKVRLRLSDPAGGAGLAAPMTVSYRCNSINTSGGTIIGRLFQGSTQIATWSTAVNNTPTNYTYTLAPGELSSITDPTDLYVEFEYSP